MKFLKTAIPGIILIEPDIFRDERGFFFENYHKEIFSKNGIRVEFVQDNHSASAKGVLRGLHYQTAPKTQCKLVRAVRGEVFDVVVDIRKGSKTYGRVVSHILNEDNHRMLFIPEGFAHGFLTLKDGTEFLYKVSEFYSPAHERGILWNDPAISIPWPKLDVEMIVSEKDKKHPTLKEAFG